MSKVILFRPKQKAVATKTDDFQQALSELYNEKGIDFLKVAINDEKENKRLTFKKYQEAMRY